MVLEFWIFGGFGRDFYATIGETVAIKKDFFLDGSRKVQEDLGEGQFNQVFAKKIWERRGVYALLTLFSLALAFFALSFASSWCVFDEMRRMGIYRQGNAQKSSS